MNLQSWCTNKPSLRGWGCQMSHRPQLFCASGFISVCIDPPQQSGKGRACSVCWTEDIIKHAFRWTWVDRTNARACQLVGWFNSASSLHRRPKGWNSLQLGSVLDAGGYCCRFVRMCVGVSMGMCVYAVMFIFSPRNLRGCLTCICESRLIWAFGVRIQRNMVVFLFDCIA